MWGEADQLLDKMLAVVDLDRKRNIYITNIVKCRRRKTATQLAGGSGGCLDYLREQTRILAPKIIVAWAESALRGLLIPDLR